MLLVVAPSWLDARSEWVVAGQGFAALAGANPRRLRLGPGSIEVFILGYVDRLDRLSANFQHRGQSMGIQAAALDQGRMNGVEDVRNLANEVAHGGLGKVDTNSSTTGR